MCLFIRSLINLSFILGDSNSSPFDKSVSEKTTITELSRILSEKPEIRKITTAEPTSISPETTNISHTAPRNIHSQQTQKQFYKSPVTLCLYGLFFLQIIALLIYLWIFFRNKPIGKGRSHISAVCINIILAF
jgi:hypothetical protein